jgi:hypothetical protein
MNCIKNEYHFVLVCPVYKSANPDNPVWKKVYYIFIFLKVNQCKFKQKETILKLGNPLKSKSKFIKSKIGWAF